jgi:hypothetical protein
MSFGQVRWALVQLNDLTWLVAQYRGWVIALATVIGGAAPLLSAARKNLPRPAPSLVIRGGAMALTLSAAAVAICSLLHFSDLRWLAPGQRGSVHLSAPGGLLSFAKPVVSALNTVTGLPAEWQAAQLSVHTAIICALLAVAAFALAVLTRRRARRADIRQIVREEIRKAAGGNRLCGTGPIISGCWCARRPPSRAAPARPAGGGRGQCGRSGAPGHAATAAPWSVPPGRRCRPSR